MERWWAEITRALVLFYSPSSEQDNDSLNNDAATAVQYGNLGRTLEGVCASVELINLDEDGHSGIEATLNPPIARQVRLPSLKSVSRWFYF